MKSSSGLLCGAFDTVFSMKRIQHSDKLYHPVLGLSCVKYHLPGFTYKKPFGFRLELKLFCTHIYSTPLPHENSLINSTYEKALQEAFWPCNWGAVIVNVLHYNSGVIGLFSDGILR